MKQLFLALALLLLMGCQPKAKNISAGVVSADTTTLYLYLDSATVLFDNADYRQSLVMAQQALPIARELCDTASIADILSYVLSDYQQLGMVDSAIITARELIEIDQLDGDAALLSNDYNNLSYIYMGSKQYDMAWELIQKAIQMELQVDGSPRLATRYGMASEVLLNLSQDPSRADSLSLRQQSLAMIDQAYTLEQARHDTLRMARRLSQKADVLAALQRDAEAELCYLQSLAYHEPIGERHSLGITYRQLGTLYLRQQKHAQAITYLEKSVDITRDENELVSLMKVYQKLQEAYKGIDEQKAYDYLTLYTQTKDSIYTLESARSLSEFHARYDTEREKEHAAASRQQLIVTWAIGAVAVLLGLLLLAWMNLQLRRRKRHNASLHEQVMRLKQQMREQEELFLQQTMPIEINTEGKPTSAESAEFVERVNAAIFKVMGNQEVTAENVASELCITSQQLRRKIKTICDVTPLAYINTIRMGYARQLLAERPDLTIEQIGLLCGYDEATHFTRSFKKEIGQTPSQYRLEKGNF